MQAQLETPEPSETPATPAVLWRGLKMLYGALVGSHLMAGGVMAVIATQQPAKLKDLGGIAYGLLLIPLCIMVAAFAVSNRQIRQATAQPDFRAKLSGYRGALYTRWVLLDGSFVAAMVLYMLTHQWVCLAPAVLSFVVFLQQSPSIETLSNELGLTTDERNQLSQ